MLEQNYPNPFNPSTIVKFKLNHIISGWQLKLDYCRWIKRIRIIMLEQNYPNPFNPSTIVKFQLNHIISGWQLKLDYCRWIKRIRIILLEHKFCRDQPSFCNVRLIRRRWRSLTILNDSDSPRLRYGVCCWEIKFPRLVCPHPISLTGINTRCNLVRAVIPEER